MKSIEQIATEVTARYENDEYQGDELSMVGQAVRDALNLQRAEILAGLNEAFPPMDNGTNLGDQEAIRAEFAERREAERIEAEAEAVENEAMIIASKQMKGPWKYLKPEVRLEIRMQARRNLGL